ncbi:hypothetical protein BGX24_004849 [Mortierella sp. AD032]|nr:hypothetical protein BGX24_004849 [Mortierella sp. AD032]
MTFDVELDHKRATRWGVESGDDWTGSLEDSWETLLQNRARPDPGPDVCSAVETPSSIGNPPVEKSAPRTSGDGRTVCALSVFTPSRTTLPRRLSSMLKHLDLASSRYVVSDHVHQVLESCPLLEEFRAPIVDMMGILDRPAWVCCGIGVLALGFIFYDSSPAVDGATADAADAADADATTNTTTTASPTTASNTTKIKELEWAVFSRLSQLYRLKLFLNSIFDAPPDTHLLHLRLEYGLELLAGWAETLEDVTLSCYNPQNMAMDDIQWIMDHWPKLRSIVCRMYNADVAVNSQIKDALTSKGIRLSSQYPF